MPVTTRDSVLQIAPELSAVPDTDARWLRFIADVEIELNPDVWDVRYQRGVDLLVAHWMTLSVRAPGTSMRGPVQSETVGGVSRTYAAGNMAMNAYDSTPYGAEYRRLARIVGGGPLA
jgi:hypothetical protein